MTEFIYFYVGEIKSGITDSTGNKGLRNNSAPTWDRVFWMDG